MKEKEKEGKRERKSKRDTELCLCNLPPSFNTQAIRAIEKSSKYLPKFYYWIFILRNLSWQKIYYNAFLMFRSFLSLANPYTNSVDWKVFGNAIFWTKDFVRMYFCKLLAGDIFRTQSNFYNGAFLRKSWRQSRELFSRKNSFLGVRLVSKYASSSFIEKF